jgi:hypothetical protein
MSEARKLGQLEGWRRSGAARLAGALHNVVSWVAARTHRVRRTILSVISIVLWSHVWAGSGANHRREVLTIQGAVQLWRSDVYENLVGPASRKQSNSSGVQKCWRITKNAPTSISTTHHFPNALFQFPYVERLCKNLHTFVQMPGAHSRIGGIAGNK